MDPHTQQQPGTLPAGDPSLNLSSNAHHDTVPMPTIGRVVHYALPNGQHRPAIVTSVQGHIPTGRTLCGLHVFLEPGDPVQGLEHSPAGYHAADCEHGAGPGSWLWPQRA